MGTESLLASCGEASAGCLCFPLPLLSLLHRANERQANVSPECHLPCCLRLMESSEVTKTPRQNLLLAILSASLSQMSPQTKQTEGNSWLHNPVLLLRMMGWGGSSFPHCWGSAGGNSWSHLRVCTIGAPAFSRKVRAGFSLSPYLAEAALRDLEGCTSNNSIPEIL